jgi:hypothetical protein
VAGQALRLARAPGFECAIPAGTFGAIG